MKSIPLWAALSLLLLVCIATQLGASASAASSSASSAAGWQRALFGRNSRNLLHRSSTGTDVGGTFDVAASNLNNAGYRNEYDQLFAPYVMEQQQQPQQQPQPPQPSALRHQQTEVYGIVEPLIEDTPCANRACLQNDDCCPTGVCVNTYGEGKCVYVYGRQRDFCQHHSDCAPGSACMLAPQEGIWRCEAANAAPLLEEVFSSRAKQPLGSDCTSSSDCQVVNGMCCQKQRIHHRAVPKMSCVYFHDAYDCVDVAQENMASLFQHRRN